MSKLHRFILCGIILLAILVRVVSLGSNPPGLHADEADTGLTALSLIKTLHDPYGNFLPLQFQSQAYNFRAPLYTYSTIPFVFILGLSAFSIRLASAMFGVLFCLCIYLISKKFIKNENSALFCTFLAAVNPWSVQLSRTGLEVNLAVLLLTAAITSFFYYGKNKVFLVISAFLFGLSVYSYHPAKITAPILILLLLVMYYKEVISNKRIFLISFIVFATMYSVMLCLALFSNGAEEFHNVNIFDQNRAKIIVDEQRTRTLAPLSISSIASNKATYYFREFTNGFFAPISFNFLFLNGENNLDKGLGNYGQYHLFELPFLALGIYFLSQRKRKLLAFFIIWFLIGLAPGAITKTGYYAYRDITILPIITVIAGFGFYISQKNILKNKVLLSFFGLSTVMILSYYLYMVFAAYPYYARDWWGYNQKEAIRYIYGIHNNYNKVIVQGGFDWVVLYAVYNNLPPEVVQKAYEQRRIVNNSSLTKIDNIYFGNIVDKGIPFRDDLNERTLVIVPGDFAQRGKTLKKFYAYDGAVNLKSYEAFK